MTDYRKRPPYQSPYDHCPVSSGPLRRWTGALTLALWALFIVLSVAVPVVIWWNS